MTIAIITLAVALAGSLAALVYVLRRQQSSLDAEVAAGKKDVADELAIQQANRERDEAIAARAKAEKEAADAKADLVTVQRDLNKTLEEHAHETVEAIRKAPTAVDALGELERLLQVYARGETVPGDVQAASGDHGGA